MSANRSSLSRIIIAGTYGLGVIWLSLAGCSGSNSSAPQATIQTGGAVVAAWGDPVAGARVYMIPVEQVDMTPITGANVLDGASEAYDEPLADLVDSGAAASFPQAVTDEQGTFAIEGLDRSKSYFPYVDVGGATPSDVLPGGSLCRVARTGDALSGMTIQVSGTPSDTATYLGSSTCLFCHSDYETQNTHAHRLGFRRPGVDGLMQSLARHPDFDKGLPFFLSASQPDDGTALWYYDWDGTRGFDKFKIAETDPGNASVLVLLWQNTADAKYMVTMRNLVNPTDPDRTYEVALTYGGALYKQRFMLKVPDPGYKGHYPFLQYQHAGDNSHYDRTRKRFRDYHLDFFWDSDTEMFQWPQKTKNIERNCMACHATGFEAFDDPTTGERLARAVNDARGDFDLDGDGILDEINTGCEVCHGPGSEHAALQQNRHIVVPHMLTAATESMICGRCHDRAKGNDDLQNDQPLNANREMAPPGTRRATWLSEYTSRRGPAMKNLWADGMHSKSHHQQYSDHIKSAHYRNTSELLACSSCHDAHGQGAYDGDLKGNPHDGQLCASCHVVSLREHMVEFTGSAKIGHQVNCTDCHYYKNAKTGAGRQALRIGPLSGTPGDEDYVFWHNDISSHLTNIARSNNPGVLGQVPGKAMPVPYTSDCGLCHNAQLLPYQDK